MTLSPTQAGCAPLPCSTPSTSSRRLGFPPRRATPSAKDSLRGG
jgi:hypothetical protein